MVKKIDVIASTLSPKNLEEIGRIYHIDPSFHPRLPGNGETILAPPDGFIGVYSIFMRAGLRFPVFPFLRTVLSHYQLRLGQITPNGFRKIMCFVLLHRALGLELSLNIFRYFYVLVPSGDWFSMSLRYGVDDMIVGLPNSIRHWKDEYFFVDSKVLGEKLVLEGVTLRGPDSPPFLTPEEMEVAELLSRHRVKWIDPDEVVLAMAGLSPTWDATGNRPILSAGGQVVSLLDRLLLKEYPYPLVVTEHPFLLEAEKVSDEISVVQPGDGLAPPAEPEVKSVVLDIARLSDMRSLGKGMKRPLESTLPAIDSQMGGGNRGLCSPSGLIDVDLVPDESLSRASYRIRRRMNARLKKDVPFHPSPSNPSEPSPSGKVVKVASLFVSVFIDLSRTVGPSFNLAVVEGKQSSGIVCRSADGSIGVELPVDSVVMRQKLGAGSKMGLPMIMEDGKEATAAVSGPGVMSIKGDYN